MDGREENLGGLVGEAERGLSYSTVLLAPQICGPGVETQC